MLGADPVARPTVVPAVSENDGVSFYFSTGDETIAQEADGYISTNGYGHTEFSVMMETTEENEPPYVIFNTWNDNMVGWVNVSVVPAAPTLSLDEGVYDEQQTVEIQSDAADGKTAIIKYIFSTDTEKGIDYQEPLKIEETTTITAWVETYDLSGEALRSNTVSATYTIWQTPGLLFYDPTIVTHVSEVTEATATVGQEFAAPALLNYYQLGVTFSSSNPDVATIDQEGNVIIVSYGETTIAAAFDGNNEYTAATASYTLTVNPMSYSVWINQTEITLANMTDVIGLGWVAYNGKGTLILNNRTRPIAIDCGTGDNLTIYLKGANQVACISGKGKLLTITTVPATPGTLELGTAESESPAINGFGVTALEGGLSWLAGDMNSITATIGTVIKPLVTEIIVTPKAEVLAPEKIAEEDKVTADDPTDQTIIINKVVDEVLYTLVVQDEGGADVNVFEEEDGKTAIVLNTAIAATDVNTAMGEEPGTASFAKAFEGVTLKVAAGSGNVVLNVEVPANATLAVKVGDAEPALFSDVTGESTMIDEAAATGDHYYGFAAANEGDDIKAGEFIQAGPGATIKPYRAYLKMHYDAARIAVKLGHSLVTGITTVEASAADNAWYTIGGTRSQSAPTQPGLYINNGKKTINK